MNQKRNVLEKVVIIGVMAFMLPVQSYACGIKGTAVNLDGSKIDGTGTISSSWNSKKAYPRDGRYELDLGDRVCGEKITVYLNDGGGSQTVRINGWTTVNFKRK